MKLIPLTIETEEIIKRDIKSISMKDNSMNFEIIEVDKGLIKAKVLRGGII
ncbi:pyruvate kinase, partial [Clostridium perfringens]|nr:pyruvate kinase [Clostridium perfringens]